MVTQLRRSWLAVVAVSSAFLASVFVRDRRGKKVRRGGR